MLAASPEFLPANPPAHDKNFLVKIKEKMNYCEFTLNSEISEGLFDAILRPALMHGSGDNIPVRGPKEFINGEWKYTFNAEGDLANFTGLEEISKNGEVVCRLYCHGGFIE